MCKMSNDTIVRYERGDGAYGVVIGRCRKGAYLELDNGESAFSRNAGNVPNNSKVICTVVRPADGRRRCLVQLDSVCGSLEAV